MNRSSRWFNLLRMTVYAGVASVLFLSCNSNSYEGMVVAVELQDTSEGSLEGAKLIAIDIQNPEKTARVLSAEFESAAAIEIPEG